MDTEKILLEIREKIAALPCELHCYRLEMIDKSLDKIEKKISAPAAQNLTQKYFFYIIIALISALTGAKLEYLLQ